MIMAFPIHVPADVDSEAGYWTLTPSLLPAPTETDVKWCDKRQKHPSTRNSSAASGHRHAETRGDASSVKLSFSKCYYLNHPA